MGLTHTHDCTETNKDLLYRTGRSVQYSVITCMRKRVDTCICLTDSLSSKAEADRALSINHSPVPALKKKAHASIIRPIGWGPSKTGNWADEQKLWKETEKYKTELLMESGAKTSFRSKGLEGRKHKNRTEGYLCPRVMLSVY